jgi:Zn-dependent protease with chaperone function
MLTWLWEFFDDPATSEARFLCQLLRQAPELPEWSAAVQPVLTRLLACNRIQRPMFSRVLTMPVLNALALPHSTIVLAESLVEFCRDKPDQLAFVLAHEAAHINLGHAKERQRANALAALLRVNPLIGFGIKMLFERAFSREQEFEADQVAVMLCARAAYAPQAATAFLTRLGVLASTTGAVDYLLSTHPPLKERITQLHATIDNLQH